MTNQNASDPSSEQNQDAAESLAPESTVTTTPDVQEQAAPSTAEGAKKPESLLDLVRDVVSKTEVESPPTETAEEKESTGTDPKPTTEGKPEDGVKAEEKDEDLPFHKHPRFQKLIQERNSLRGEAEQFRAIADYMTEQNLSADEVDTGFAIMAALKNDPLKARSLLLPYMKQLDAIAGEVLPEELKQQVEDGEVSEELARELARAKALLAVQTERQTAMAESHRVNAAQAAQQQIVASVEAWEQSIITRDPDYKAKQALVYQAIKAANLERPARTPQEAIAIAEKALAEVNEAVKGFTPRKPAIAQQPKASQSVPSAKPQPKSLRDVVKLAVNR